MVERTDLDPHPALWMLLLLRLTGVSKDQRAEVRNGKSLFRYRLRVVSYLEVISQVQFKHCLEYSILMDINLAPKHGLLV